MVHVETLTTYVIYVCHDVVSKFQSDLRVMSYFHLAPHETKISIPLFDTEDGTEYFLIRVKCWHDKEWTVSRRFREFSDLHEKLQKEIVIKNLLKIYSDHC